MPVTVKPSDHGAASWNNVGSFELAKSATGILRSITSAGDAFWGEKDSSSGPIGDVIQTSLSDLAQGQGQAQESTSSVFAAKNGLVHACVEAYNYHHHLVIRPEDVWFAILTQLSAYINAHAEEMRDKLVTHEGKKKLFIEARLEGLDHGKMAYHMTKLMTETLKDASLREWILPAFSTTEKDDQAVASIVMMGMMKAYYTYSWGTCCGLPSVTLLGEEEDWVEIYERCEARMGSGDFGPDVARWCDVLRPVLRALIATFQAPESAETKLFWQSIVDVHPQASGSTTYSGWITAFWYWNEKGQCLHDRPQSWRDDEGRVRLTLDQVPMGFIKAPVTLLDDGVKIPTEMLAGSVAVTVSKSGGEYGPGLLERYGGDEDGVWAGFDTVQPRSGWFMYKINEH